MSAGWSSPQGRLLSRVGLGLVGRLIPAGLVDEVLAATERVERRWRVLPSRLGVYVVLALCLLRTKSYGSVLRAMIPASVLSKLRVVGWCVPCTKAVSMLRDRIGALPLELLFGRLAGWRPTVRRSWSHAFGLLVCAWDGTEVELADNDRVAGRFGRHRGRTGAVGVPKARLLVLLACGSRQLIDAAIGGLGKGEGEVSLAHRLAGSLRAGMLLLADRNFLNYRLWTACRDRGAHLLWRARQNKPRLPVCQVLPEGSYLSVLYDPDALRAWRRNVRRNRKRGHRPPKPRPIKGITVRVVEALITVTVDGTQRTERYLLVTSLLDPHTAPAEQLVALYARRWVAETGIREIKTVLLERRALRGTTPIRIRQELWAALIVYQAIRLLICQAALTQELDPSRISFTAARDTTQRMITTTPSDTTEHLEGIYQDLCQQLITRHTHHRIFPRTLKNTLSRYPYRGKTRQLTSGKASYQATILTPTTNTPPTTPTATPAQPRAA
jgi:hypothetical protein